MITIVIPVYNVALYVRNSLLSALNQTFTDIEYLLIDDCGNDASMTIVKEMLQDEKYITKNIKIIRHKTNRGLSSARNTGLENATGKYIFFMDSDDEITPNCIELHYNAITMTSANFTVANIELVNTKSKHIKPISSAILKVSPIESYLKQGWNVSACNKLYNVEFLKKNGFKFKDNLLHEDVLWNYQISLLSEKIAFVEEATYQYKVHDDSIVTSKSSKKKLDSLIYILNVLFSDWNNKKLSKQVEKSFCSFFNYWRFVTALQLLNYDGDVTECQCYYNEISKLNIRKYNTIYCLFLLLPFRCFSMIRPIYMYYKNRK